MPPDKYIRSWRGLGINIDYMRVLSDQKSPIENLKLLNHLGRPCQHIRRRQTDLLGRLQIDDELELLGCSTDRSVGLMPRYFMCSCDNIHRPRDWRSLRSMACISGFGMVPTFRSIMVCFIVRKIPVTRDGKSSPAPFHPATR